MGIEIAARANSSTGLDVLPSFMVDYPTVGDLRNAFARPQISTPQPEPTSDFSMLGSASESTIGSSTAFVDNTTAVADNTWKNHTLDLEVEEDIVMISSPVEDDSPAPSTRVTLLQGRPSSGKRPFYLIADGTGSIATYIHLPQFRAKMPVYGIDSPYLRCPSRLTTEVGIPGAAKFIVEALIKFQPEGLFSIGGFSGGAMLGYEVCRQLAAAGRTVDSLLLIDMCCPRPAGAMDKAEVGWKVYESIASQGGLWNASNTTQKHLRAIFASVAAYHPTPMTVKERPRRTAIIWAKRGLIDRCSGDRELMKLLANADIPTKPFAGFMENPKMGAIAWGLPHKTSADLGPNGWDKYVGEALCLSVDADHLEMPMPGHVHLLYGAMEEAFTYLSGPHD
jgi:zearalenone synthase (nonreducing iterative type I polyketide synthase)